MQSLMLFDFSENSKLSNWRVLDDVVMGGRSNGEFFINKEGNAVFQGFVSLENNGGFSSVRCWLETTNVENFNQVRIRLKGDGKTYQFRVKSNRVDRFSYVYSFETSGLWQIVTIPLNEMIPQFRGRKLRMKNFSGEQMEEMAFLIGNKKAEKFELQIDKIVLE